jgi:UDP-glucose 4-epimerase
LSAAILVTGGLGFVGSHLVDALLARGDSVTVLDNLFSGTERPLPHPRCRVILGDIRSDQDLETALEGVSQIIHLAADVTIRESMDNFLENVDVNLMGTLKVLQKIRARKIERFILASSMSVYADGQPGLPVAENHPLIPLSPYGVSKLAAEQMCAQVLGDLGISHVALRYFNIFGPGQKYSSKVGVITAFIRQLREGLPLQIYGDGTQSRDYVHVHDIVAGTIAALKSSPGTYNLGTGKATTLHDLVAMIEKSVGCAAKLSYGPAKKLEPRHLVADIGLARAHLGFSPARGLQEEIEKLVKGASS